VPSAPTSGSWIPKDLHDKTVTVLTDRVVLAEDCLKALLHSIDPELLERHLYDYVAAVKELTS
jgi:hypothetical protein